MHFYTYKITNLLNGKFYIGAHKTKNLNDKYMGSGKIIKKAILKYGILNFKKDILMFHDSENDMYEMEEMEELIVDQHFIDRCDTYNIKLGGQGGWNYINSNASIISKRNKKRSKLFVKKINSDSNFNQKFSSKMSDIQKKIWGDPEYKKRMLNVFRYDFTDKKHSNEAKEKMKKSHLQNDHQKGEKNSQYGKMWIYSLELKKSTKINKTDPIPEGWFKGRKFFK